MAADEPDDSPDPCRIIMDLFCELDAGAASLLKEPDKTRHNVDEGVERAWNYRQQFLSGEKCIFTTR